MENNIHFVRGNNVSLGEEECLTRAGGVGYGDSYVMDQAGKSSFARGDMSKISFSPTSIRHRPTKLGAWGDRSGVPRVRERLREIVEKNAVQ